MHSSDDFEFPDYDLLGASIVHDFNNLLTPIVSLMSELQRDGIGSERQRSKIDGVVLCTLRARALAYQLLDLSKFCRVEPEVVDLKCLLSPLEPIYSSLLGAGIQVKFDVPVDLPMVRLDPSLFERAMLNLVLNARNVMFNGGQLTISAATDKTINPERSMVRITVTDTGPFTDFPSAHEALNASPSRARGNGLGLAMVKRFVAGTGGQVTVVCDPERGTAVRLRIPSIPR